MDSQSSTTSDQWSFLSTPTPIRSGTPVARALELTIDGVLYRKVGHPANQRKRSKQSHIWDYGEEYRREGDSITSYWICGVCPIRRVVAHNVKNQSSGAISHLRNKHRIVSERQAQDGPEYTSIAAAGIDPALEVVATTSTAESMPAPSLVGRTVKTFYTQVHIDLFRWRLIKWIVCCHITLDMVANDHFRDLIMAIAPSLMPYLVASGTTVRAWIGEAFDREKAGLKRRLSRAQSKVHISCDLWTSPSQLAMLGIVLHYLDETGNVVHVLGGLRRVQGTHTGENISVVVVNFVKEMGIQAKLGYFIGDNAASNDTCWDAVLRVVDSPLSAADSRMRCLGHIINLIAKDFIFGDGKAFLDETASKDERDHADELRKIWRKTGPLGKLRNTITYIRSSPQRREAFHELCSDLVQDEYQDLNVILDNETRWNSTYASVARAIKLMPKIKLYSIEKAYEKDLGEDCLTNEDWDRLQWIAISMQPFYNMTLETQGKTSGAGRGAIWESISVLYGIDTHLKTLKKQWEWSHIEQVQISIKNAANKTIKYLKLLCANATYITAILLHPYMRKAWLDTRFTTEEAKTMTDLAWKLWSEHYHDPFDVDHLLPPEEDWEVSTSFRSYTIPINTTPGLLDEFWSFITSPPLVARSRKEANETDPLNWWKSNGAQFPSLCTMAKDVYTIPSMSAECERVFSSTKLLITPGRSRLNADIIEWCECLRQWIEVGFTTTAP